MARYGRNTIPEWIVDIEGTMPDGVATISLENIHVYGFSNRDAKRNLREYLMRIGYDDVTADEAVKVAEFRRA